MVAASRLHRAASRPRIGNMLMDKKNRQKDLRAIPVTPSRSARWRVHPLVGWFGI
jgi:hypothetical protein